MIKELVKDTELLSQKCEPATAEDASVAEDLVDTLTNLEDAACLAANQIGVTKAIIAYLDENDKPCVMYNPSMKQAMGAYKADEGCFSIEAISKVTRYAKIKVTYDELVGGNLISCKKEFTGWTAQMIQHMIDHCRGKLI